MAETGVRAKKIARRSKNAASPPFATGDNSGYLLACPNAEDAQNFAFGNNLAAGPSPVRGRLRLGNSSHGQLVLEGEFGLWRKLH